MEIKGIPKTQPEKIRRDFPDGKKRKTKKYWRILRISGILSGGKGRSDFKKGVFRSLLNLIEKNGEQTKAYEIKRNPAKSQESQEPSQTAMRKRRQWP